MLQVNTITTEKPQPGSEILPILTLASCYTLYCMLMDGWTEDCLVLCVCTAAGCGVVWCGVCGSHFTDRPSTSRTVLSGTVLYCSTVLCQSIKQALRWDTMIERHVDITASPKICLSVGPSRYSIFAVFCLAGKTLYSPIQQHIDK
jgi:hypothetical protein